MVNLELSNQTTYKYKLHTSEVIHHNSIGSNDEQKKIVLFDNSHNAIELNLAVTGKTYTVGFKNQDSLLHLVSSNEFNTLIYINSPYNAITNNISYNILQNFTGSYPTFRFNYPFILGDVPLLKLYFYERSNTGVPIPDRVGLIKIISGNDIIESLNTRNLNSLTDLSGNIQSQINNIGDIFSKENTWIGENTFFGFTNIRNPYSQVHNLGHVTTSTFECSFYYGTNFCFTIGSQVLNTVTIYNIDISVDKLVELTFYITPLTENSPWYIKPSTNFVRIVNINNNLTIDVPVIGVSNVVFPSSYTTIVQNLKIGRFAGLPKAYLSISCY